MMVKKLIVCLVIVTSLSLMAAGCNKGSSEQADGDMNQTTGQPESSAQ